MHRKNLIGVGTNQFSKKEDHTKNSLGNCLFDFDVRYFTKDPPLPYWELQIANYLL